MNFTILGVGTALPGHFVPQDRLAELTSGFAGHTEEQARRLAILYRRAGIRSRHVAVLEHPQSPPGPSGEALGPSTRWRMGAYEEHVGPLALQAAGRALSSAGVGPGEITHLVTVSCTGFAAPGFDLAIVHDLGLDPGVARTHVGFMGCHGAINGLRVAGAFAAADPSARVLLCAAELCTLHVQYGWDTDHAVANALFADGAAALVGAAPGAPGRPGVWRLAANGSCLTPGTEDAMTWRVGDHGFEMTLSPSVPRLIGEHLRPWLVGWLARHDLGLGDIASWAVHPGGTRILDAVESAIGVDRAATEDSREVLASCGNMSSPTVLFILDRLRRRRDATPCVALAFGPGLAIEAALFL